MRVSSTGRPDHLGSDSALQLAGRGCFLPEGPRLRGEAAEQGGVLYVPRTRLVPALPSVSKVLFGLSKLFFYGKEEN